MQICANISNNAGLLSVTEHHHFTTYGTSIRDVYELHRLYITENCHTAVCKVYETLHYHLHNIIPIITVTSTLKKLMENQG